MEQGLDQELIDAARKYFADKKEILLRLCTYIANASPEKILGLKFSCQTDTFEEHVMIELNNTAKNEDSEKKYKDIVEEIVETVNEDPTCLENIDVASTNEYVDNMEESETLEEKNDATSADESEEKYEGNEEVIKRYQTPVKNKEHMKYISGSSYAVLKVLQQIVTAPVTKQILQTITVKGIALFVSIGRRAVISTGGRIALVTATKISAVTFSGSISRAKTVSIPASQEALELGNMCRIIGVALITLQLSYCIVSNIRRWCKGEISGKRCCKNVIDEIAAISGSAGGGTLGSVVGGMVFGPLGAVAGAIAGGIAVGCAAQSLSNWLTNKLFNLSPSEALDKAYEYFKLSPSCSNAELNHEYRHLARRLHPDKDKKGIYKDEWNRMQYYLAVIAVSRE